MTLDQTWKKCIAMWVKIVKNLDKGTVYELKQKYVDDGTLCNCYFCQYNVDHGGIEGRCDECPGRLVKKGFNCAKGTYSYQTKPKKFLEKLLELDEIRRQN